MKKIEYYEAFDGTRFDTKQKCLEYENSYKDIAKARESIKFLHDFCSERACSDCPLVDEYGCCALSKDCPEDWEEESN